MKISITWDTSFMSALQPGRFGRAVAAALRKAGATALRDMKAEASKRIRKLKRLKASAIAKTIVLSKPTGGAAALIAGEWALRMTGQALPLIDYPHRLVTQSVVGKDGKSRKRKVLRVEVNPGKQTLVPGAFLATMRSGHEGIFRRVGPARLPIKELLGSRPVDALLKAGEAEAVGERGQKSLVTTFERLLPLELAKAGK